LDWEWCQCLMWLGSDLIDVVLPNETLSVKPDTKSLWKISYYTYQTYLWDFEKLDLITTSWTIRNWFGVKEISEKRKMVEYIYKDEMRWVGLIVTDEWFPYEEANDMRCDKSVTISLLIITITNICRDYTVSVGCSALCICIPTTHSFIHLLNAIKIFHQINNDVRPNPNSQQPRHCPTVHANMQTHQRESFKSGQHGQEYFKMIG